MPAKNSLWAHNFTLSLLTETKQKSFTIARCAAIAPHHPAKNSFVFWGIVQIHKIGDAWEWVLK